MAQQEPGLYGSENSFGHSGSETSKTASKKAAGRSEQVLKLVTDHGENGATTGELEYITRAGHGAISGALTRLHRSGNIVRLQRRRNGKQVYVAPQFAGDEEQSPYRPNVAYRDGYKKPMALDVDELPTQEQFIRALSAAEVVMPQAALNRVLSKLK
jgi:hypothetical protein